ncbi:hypothetical protein G7Y79_00003g011860 [Physcia stellaris]|nr:hypothetical protein G7Y79_00003g011860 [Physcia stellaris]
MFFKAVITFSIFIFCSLAISVALPRSQRPNHVNLSSPTSPHSPTNRNSTTLLNTTPSTHPTCYPPTLDRYHKPLHPRIISLADCGRAARDLISARSGPPTDAEAWYPVRHEWADRSCGISLMPNGAFSVDTFSRGAIMAAAFRVKSACVNEANGWRGGEVVIGGEGAFEVGVFGMEEWRPGQVLE